MRLSRREAEARRKIVQEYHLRKKEQHELDDYTVNFKKTYREIYDDEQSLLITLMQIHMVVALGELAEAFRKVGTNMKAATEAMQNVGEVMARHGEVREEEDV